MLGVRRRQHHIAGTRVVVPAPVRLEVHGAEFPLPQRVADARLEASFLLCLADFQPNLDQHDAAVDHDLFDLRAKLEKAPVLLFSAKSHDEFNAGAIVPTTVEDDDLARGRKLLDVALREHLRFFAIRRCRQGDDPEHPRAHLLGESLDGSSLAGGVATFEQYYDPAPFGFHPLLQVTKLDLQLAQFGLVGLSLELGTGVGGLLRCHWSPRVFFLLLQEAGRSAASAKPRYRAVIWP